MDIKVEKAVKKDVIKWIKTLHDEKVLYILHDMKERNREITTEEKEEYNRWLSKLDYQPQIELLRSVIASLPNGDTIWNELSPEAQKNLRMDGEVKRMDKEYIPERFWDLVRDLKKGDDLSSDDLSEEDIESIKRGIADSKAGRTTPHEEVMVEVQQWLNEMKFKNIKEYVVDLPVEMRAEIADFVTKTLSRPNPKVEKAWAEEARRRLNELASGEVEPIPGEQVHQELRKKYDKTNKENLLRRIEKMPDDITIDEAMSMLNSLYDVELSIRDGGENSITQDELEEEFRKEREQRKNKK